MGADGDSFFNVVTQTIRTLATHSPVLLVWCAGIFLAITRWRRHPKVSLLATLGFAVLMATTLVWTGVWNIAVQMIAHSDRPDRLRAILMIGPLLYSVVHAVGWGLVLAALFGYRTPYPYTPSDPTYYARQEIDR